MKTAANIIREKGIRTAKGKFLPELDKRRRREADLFESGIKQQSTINIPKVDNLEQASKENQNLKEQLNKDKASATITNAQVTNVNQQGAPTPSPQPNVDDRPAYLRKKDGR